MPVADHAIHRRCAGIATRQGRPVSPAGWPGERREIRPDVASYLQWAGGPGKRTGIALIYVHGFSASPGELRPLPEDLARQLGANLLGLRLTGHGQDGAALARARLRDWQDDLAQALQFGRQLGGRVIVLGMSTGATLLAQAACDPRLSDAFDAAIFVSPNFRLRHPAASALNLPGIRLILTALGDPKRRFLPRNELHAARWTSCYPISATLPVAELTARARRTDFAAAQIPAIFIWAARDRVVDHRESGRIARRWGGPAMTLTVEPGERDDPNAHVIAGDALSPAMSRKLTQAMARWISTYVDQNVREK